MATPASIGLQLVGGMELGALFRLAGYEAPDGPVAAFRITGLEDDSRKATSGSAFLAIRGETVDGHDYIEQALDRGAQVAIAERLPAEVDSGRVVLLPDTRQAAGRLAQAFHGFPSRAMTIVGITGTKGKTTISYLAESLLVHGGRRPALFGTVEYRFGDRRMAAPNTTPGALFLAQAMAEYLSAGADSVTMEVSSHALQQGRVEGVDFDVALMTNLTHEHLDFHGTMEDYAAAKHLLFTRHAPRISIFNLDDPTASEFSRAHGGKQLTYSLESAKGASLSATELILGADGIWMKIRFANGQEHYLGSPLRGRFNASNLLGAAAIGSALGFEPAVIVEGLKGVRGAPGRFESVEAGQPFAVYVDYAHAPNPVECILENVRAITKGRVIIVLGCGGDRDRRKRPIMGEIMGRLADYSIITTDNPRTEDPAKIAAAMEEGIRVSAKSGAYEVCLDRRTAIRRALEFAQPGDSVIVAGKGHETYQEVNKVRYPFDDREVVREICQEIYGQ